MPELTNPHDFAVSVPALGRELAPFETIVVEDVDIVRNAIATGVLYSDLETLDEDARKLVDDVKAVGAEIAATWHREHGRDGLAGAVPDADRRDTPFVSAAQVNHVEGQLMGDAKVAARADGVIVSPVLSQDNGESATPDTAPVERRAGPTEAGFNPRESNIPPLSDVSPTVTAALTPAPASEVTKAAGEESADGGDVPPVDGSLVDEAALTDNEAKPVPFQPEPVVAAETVDLTDPVGSDSTVDTEPDSTDVTAVDEAVSTGPAADKSATDETDEPDGPVDVPSAPATESE